MDNITEYLTKVLDIRKNNIETFRATDSILKPTENHGPSPLVLGWVTEAYSDSESDPDAESDTDSESYSYSDSYSESDSDSDYSDPDLDLDSARQVQAAPPLPMTGGFGFRLNEAITNGGTELSYPSTSQLSLSCEFYSFETPKVKASKSKQKNGSPYAL